MCHPDVLPLFSQVGQDDNLSNDRMREESLWTLHAWTDEDKQKRLSFVEDKMAQNLLSQMLSKDPMKRPTVERIKGHPFLSEKKVARMIGMIMLYLYIINYGFNDSYNIN